MYPRVSTVVMATAKTSKCHTSYGKDAWAALDVRDCLLRVGLWLHPVDEVTVYVAGGLFGRTAGKVSPFLAYVEFSDDMGV